MTLSKYFKNCAYDIHYQQAGDSVNYAFVESEDHSTLIIYFQGSNSITDWVRNFLFTKKVFDEFKVHRGFLDAYMEVRNIILDKAYEKKYSASIVVGYSHGGALCQLALEDLVYHFSDMQDSIFGYAFESPRCVKAKNKLGHGNMKEMIHNQRDTRGTTTHKVCRKQEQLDRAGIQDIARDHHQDR